MPTDWEMLGIGVSTKRSKSGSQCPTQMSEVSRHCQSRPHIPFFKMPKLQVFLQVGNQLKISFQLKQIYVVKVT